MIPASFTSSEAASNGFFAINLTFSIMRSKGSSTIVWASFVKKIDANDSTIHTKRVREIFNMDSIWFEVFIEYTTENYKLSVVFIWSEFTSESLKFIKYGGNSFITVVLEKLELFGSTISKKTKGYSGT